MHAKPLILLVDDEIAILDVVRYNLEKANFRVMTSRDGREALQLSQSARTNRHPPFKKRRDCIGRCRQRQALTPTARGP